MDFLTGPETYVKKERDTLKDGDSAGFILLRCDGAVNRKLHDEGAAGRGFTLISLLTTTPWWRGIDAAVKTVADGASGRT